MVLVPSARLAVAAAGIFLLWGMALGVWKYRHMLSAPTHEAPVYVDIAHRAALLYAFAALVLAALAQWSAWPEAVNLAAVAIELFFFATAVASYVFHGARGREQTQFSERNLVTTWGMALLIVGELGGVLVLLGGFLRGT